MIYRVIASFLLLFILTGCDDKSKEYKKIYTDIAINSPYIDITKDIFISEFNKNLLKLNSKLNYKIIKEENTDGLYTDIKIKANEYFDMDIVTYLKQNNKIESILFSGNPNTTNFDKKIRENLLALVMTILNIDNSDEGIKYFPKNSLNNDFFANSSKVKSINMNLIKENTQIEFNIVRFKTGYISVKIIAEYLK